MIQLIGNRQEFAIEFKISDPQNSMGYAKIWMSSRFLGTIHDLIYLKSYLLEGLNQILKSEQLDSRIYNTFLNYNLKNTYYYLKHNLTSDNEAINTYRYLVHFGTFTDDYLVFSFRHGEDLYIFWKIVNKNSIFKDVRDDKKKVNYFKTSVAALEPIVAAFEDKLRVNRNYGFTI